LIRDKCSCCAAAKNQVILNPAQELSMASPLSTELRASLQARLAPFEALDTCHREVMQQLQTLDRLVNHLAQHGVDDLARRLATAAMAFFSTHAQQHHADEERLVFPPLLAGSDVELIQHVRRLQQDHSWLEEDWRELALPLGAVADGYSWFDIDALRHGVEVFAALYHDHIALEETLIYPEARRALNAEAQGVGRRLAELRRSSPARV
jgi:iron-sulfur cluster repair protein YtfE (RIC family)